MWPNFLKSLDADDIFISYSRADGTAYRTGLDAALSKQGFSCFADNYGTDANPLPPKTLFEKIRVCKTLVLLATPGALSKPENIAPELTEFAAANGTARIICISFDQGAEFTDWSKTPWYSLVQGKARERENPNLLITGEPSSFVVTNIAKASNYMKGKDRLRKYRNRALAGFLGLLLAGLLAGGFALYGFGQARKASNEAIAARNDADLKIAKAAADTKKAQDQAQGDIQKAKDQAQQEIKQAQDDAQVKISHADGLARAAEDRRAAAQNKADQELARADREHAIGDARSLANRSEVSLRQRPEAVPRSMSLAVSSLTKSAAIGVPVVEADSAMRDNLALLPRLRYSKSYEDGTPIVLSPDGRHFAIVKDNKLQAYELGNETPLREIDCQCSVAALSSQPLYAAAVTEEGIKIFSLEKNEPERVVKLEAEVSPEKIAFSPDAAYLAFVSDAGEDVGRYSRMGVAETKSGKTVVLFDDDPEGAATTERRESGEAGGNAAPAKDSSVRRSGLNMLIADIAFGPTGNLAVGGKTTIPVGGRLIGQVAIWSFETPADAGNTAKLTTASFSGWQVVPQQSEVSAVVPGVDSDNFATNSGVWKRTSGQTNYLPVARLPYLRKFESSSSIEKMAFRVGDGSLMLVRQITADGNDADGENETTMEVWDTTGHHDLTRVFHDAQIEHVGFKPGEELLATMTERTSSEEPSRAFEAIGGKRLKGILLEPGNDDGELLYVSPDSRYRITIGEGVAVVWDVWGRKKTSANFADALTKLEVAAIDPGGNFLALSGTPKDGGSPVIVYRLASDTFVEQKRIQQNGIPGSLYLSADGERLAVLYRDDSNRAWVFDVNSGTVVGSKLFENLGDVKHLALSPNGRFVVSVERNAGSNRTRLLDLSRMESIDLFDDTVIGSIAFSLDNKYLAIGSDEGIVHVFETLRPDFEVARLQHTGRITAIAFSDNDKYLATASSDRHPYRINEEESYPLRVWLLQSADLIKEATSRLARLSPAAE